MRNKGEKTLRLSNPDKLLFPEAGITKLEYVKKLHALSPFLLYYTKNHYLTTIHYPDGVGSKSYFQKNIPSHAPDFVSRQKQGPVEYIVMDSAETLFWLGNMAAIEFHLPFNRINHPDYPDALIFDLDPSEGQRFDQVAEAALMIYGTLKELGIKGYCKTSGATGLQIAIPLGRKLHYDTARKINWFFSKYFVEKYPRMFTVERKVKSRGNRLYFDYLQMWKGKTIISPYSPRATEKATVATPITWEELKEGIYPEDFTLKNTSDRIMERGDLYKPVIESGFDPGLNDVLPLL